MIRGSTAVTTAVLGVALLTGGLAAAADKDNPEAAPPAAATPPAAQTPAAGTGSLGVPYEVRTGFWVEGQVGLFTAFLGSKGASNAQPWVDIQLGFDIPGVRRLSLFVSAGHGFNDSSCRYYNVNGIAGCAEYPAPNTNPSDNLMGQAATDFSVIPIELGARYGFPDLAPWSLPNLFINIVGVVGYTIYTPLLMQNGPTGSADIGVGVGIEYDTRLPGFSFGIELINRFGFLSGIAATASNPALPAQVLWSLQVYPRFQYVF